MRTIETPVSSPAADTAASGTSAARPWVDALLYAGLLVLLRAVIGEGFYIMDEYAYLAQVDLLADTGSWTTTYPTAGVLDPVPQVAPLSLSFDGVDTWAPYVRHPLYVVVLSAASAVAGVWGPVLVSIAAAVVAVSVMTRTVGALVPELSSRAVFWALAGSSLSVVHAQVVWAHAPAIALAAIAVHLLVRRPDPSWVAIVTAGASLATVVMLRTEGVFLVVGCATVAALSHGGPRRPMALVRAATVAGIGVVGFVSDRLIAQAIVGAAAPTPPGGVRSAGYLDDRVSAVVGTLIDGGPGPSGVGRQVVLVCLLVGAYLIARRKEVHLVVPLAAVAAVISIVVAVLDGAALLKGFLPATPLVAVGLAAAPSVERLRPLVAGAMVTVAGVLMTSPADAGGQSWAGRYALVALPLVVPVAAAGVVRLWRSSTGGSAILAAATIATIGGTWAGLAYLQATHAGSHRVIEQLEPSIEELAEAPGVLVTPDIRLGRAMRMDANRIPLLSADHPHRFDAVLEAVVADRRELPVIEMVLLDGPSATSGYELPDGWRTGAERTVGPLTLVTLLPPTE